MRFPLTPTDPEDKEFVEIVNAAFYSGYMLARSNGKVASDNATFLERIAIMCLAKAQARETLEEYLP